MRRLEAEAEAEGVSQEAVVRRLEDAVPREHV